MANNKGREKSEGFYSGVDWQKGNLEAPGLDRAPVIQLRIGL